MDINLLIGIAGLILSVGSLIYAPYEKKKSVVEKKLVYDVIPSVSVAEAIKDAGPYSLKVVYERPSEKPIYIENAYMQLVRFTNFGKEPIQQNDIAPKDPLRLIVKSGNVLHISLFSQTRDVCEIKISEMTNFENGTSATINFEFLDYMDGGLIQILSDKADLDSTLTGTIVGMPNGIEKTAISLDSVEVPNWGCALGLVFEILSLATVPFIYKYYVGNWDYVWLLIVPIVALIFPFLLFNSFMAIFSFKNKNKFEFPSQLIPPRWYQIGSGFHYPPRRKRDQREKQKLIAEIESLKKQLKD